MESQIDQKENSQLIAASKIIRQSAITLSAIYILVLIGTHLMREQLMEYNTWISLGYFLIMLLMIIYTQLQVREKSNGGIISFGSAFGTGLKLSIWVAFIFAIFNLIFYLFIFPNAGDEVLRIAEQSMREQGRTEQEIEMGMKMTGWMLSPLGVFISTIVMYPLMGIIASLISAAFTQRSK